MASRAVAAASAFLTFATLSLGQFITAVNSMAGESPLVALRRVDPTIQQDMRYAGPDNFTGARVPGYQAAECWLRPSVAKALARVQADLAGATPKLSLKVFDCYRPRRAVAAFVAWADAPEDGHTRHYYPNVPRNALVARGYIGSASTHAKGISIDLTLVRVHDGTDVAATGSPAEQRAVVKQSTGLKCTQSSDRTRDPMSLDMGTTFDCFDPKSHTEASGLTAEQRSARQALRRAMQRHGFSNFAKEWWHYTYTGSDGPSLDVPVVSSGTAVRKD